MPHSRWGESPCAFVVLKNFEGVVTEDDIIGYCKKNMPPFMVPKVVKIVEELTKTSTGKIQKFELREKAKNFISSEKLGRLTILGSHIRIYNVDKGWKVQKNILAKSLRWTITDTSLSPDQRYLVSAMAASSVCCSLLLKCFWRGGMSRNLGCGSTYRRTRSWAYETHMGQHGSRRPSCVSCERWTRSLGCEILWQFRTPSCETLLRLIILSRPQPPFHVLG
ncbi:hypothetical protein Fmac_031194 [Flemingia macrophylla]|uniref:AMP-binding enzyme C-terminal domain-containing protein n=1 Tax=Flemingia macrophylla TaxID=520843 RepID=A0ABD1L1U1_9FABA